MKTGRQGSALPPTPSAPVFLLGPELATEFSGPVVKLKHRAPCSIVIKTFKMVTGEP